MQMGRFATGKRGREEHRTLKEWAMRGEWFRVEFFGGGAIFVSCRYTNFTANNAVRTARFLYVPAIGRAQSVRSAARQSWRRNSRPLRQPTREAHRPNQPSAAADAARAVGVTDS